MRFDINLATRPYVDLRRFYTHWLLLLGVLLLVAGLLLGSALRSLYGSRDVARKVRETRQQIAELDRHKAHAEQVMARPENRDVRERSQFLNGLIARRAFSWTQVFADLEKIVPERVQVAAIRPEITKDNRLQIVMRVLGDSRASANELMKRMEASQSFREPQLRSESVRREGGRVEFDIAAYYAPQGVASPAPPKQGGQ